MSRKIKASVDLLRSSLDKCKTSIANKGVSVPSTTKVSGLPALIDKIQTTMDIMIPFSQTSFDVLGSTGEPKTYQYLKFVLYDKKDKSIAAQTQAYKYRPPTEMGGHYITLRRVNPGEYFLGISLDDNEENLKSGSPSYVNKTLCSINTEELILFGNRLSAVVTILIEQLDGIDTIYINNQIVDNGYISCSGVKGAQVSYKKTGDSKIYKGSRTITVNKGGIYTLGIHTNDNYCFLSEIDAYGTPGYLNDLVF